MLHILRAVIVGDGSQHMRRQSFQSGADCFEGLLGLSIGYFGNEYLSTHALKGDVQSRFTGINGVRLS